jgi:histidine triad (HIT) family protein
MTAGKSKPDCIFCRVVAGELPSTKVFESETVLAFQDVNPGAPQHILVIPKDHIAESIADLELTDSDVAQTWTDLLTVAQEIAGAKPEFADGWRFVTNVGENGGQSVFHLHVHLLAGRRLAWPPG